MPLSVLFLLAQEHLPLHSMPLASSSLSTILVPSLDCLRVGAITALWTVVVELIASVIINVMELDSRAPDFWQRLRLYAALVIAATLLAFSF